MRPFRFWTKPIDRRRLVYGIDSAIQELYKNNQFINVMVNSENIQIFISNIIYIYVQNKKTHIITTKGEIIVSIPYQTVFEQVKDYTNFFEPLGILYKFQLYKRYGKDKIYCGYRRQNMKYICRGVSKRIFKKLC